MSFLLMILESEFLFSFFIPLLLSLIFIDIIYQPAVELLKKLNSFTNTS